MNKDNYLYLIPYELDCIVCSYLKYCDIKYYCKMIYLKEMPEYPSLYECGFREEYPEVYSEIREILMKEKERYHISRFEREYYKIKKPCKIYCKDKTPWKTIYKDFGKINYKYMLIAHQRNVIVEFSPLDEREDDDIDLDDSDTDPGERGQNDTYLTWITFTYVHSRVRDLIHGSLILKSNRNCYYFIQRLDKLLGYRNDTIKIIYDLIYSSSEIRSALIESGKLEKEYKIEHFIKLHTIKQSPDYNFNCALDLIQVLVLLLLLIRDRNLNIENIDRNKFCQEHKIKSNGLKGEDLINQLEKDLVKIINKKFYLSNFGE